MSRKSKGINAERELVHLFHSVKGWAAVRVAGSGSSHYPSPDVIASNSERVMAIECKCVKGTKKYLPLKGVEQLLVFGGVFGAECWIGVYFIGKGWRFFLPRNLTRTSGSLVVSREEGGGGVSFDELVNRKV